MMSTIKQLQIRHKNYEITVDRDYGCYLGERFEPNTIAILEAMCDQDSRVLDIGANIGVTAIALSQLCPQGKIIAIEPVPRTYALLIKNISRTEHTNIAIYNYALGNSEGEIVMQGNPNNLSGAFIADQHAILDGIHFNEMVKIYKLDNIFSTFDFDRLNFIKIDVEGYELDVLDGGLSILARYRPIVLLEMNHIVLNLWRGISLPQFRKRLLKIFPFVYAIKDGSFLDLTNEIHSHAILFSHLHNWQHYIDIVARFDKIELISRLERISSIYERNEQFESNKNPMSLSLPSLDINQEVLQDPKQHMINLQEKLNLINAHSERLQIELNEVVEHNNALIQSPNLLQASNSWKMTSPLRRLKKWLKSK